MKMFLSVASVKLFNKNLRAGGSCRGDGEKKMSQCIFRKSQGFLVATAWYRRFCGFSRVHLFKPLSRASANAVVEEPLSALSWIPGSSRLLVLKGIPRLLTRRLAGEMREFAIPPTLTRDENFQKHTSNISQSRAAAKGDEDEYRKKLKELYEVKKQMDELDEEFESLFTVDYVQKLCEHGSESEESESGSEDYSSSDSSDSGLEDIAPSFEELHPDVQNMRKV